VADGPRVSFGARQTQAEMAAGRHRSLEAAEECVEQHRNYPRFTGLESAVRLRGIPFVGRGVGGPIRGTAPGRSSVAEVAAVEDRPRRRPTQRGALASLNHGGETGSVHTTPRRDGA
jgi:hypothetical protein